MKRLLIAFLVLLATPAFSEFRAPKGFHVVRGENGDGDDDTYTNGRYTFASHKLFREYDYNANDTATRTRMREFFGFPFYYTKDGLCWGTGYSQGTYSYVVIQGGEVIELYARTKDSGFAYYSKWLLSVARAYNKSGDLIIFPMHAVKPGHGYTK